MTIPLSINLLNCSLVELSISSQGDRSNASVSIHMKVHVPTYEYVYKYRQRHIDTYIFKYILVFLIMKIIFTHTQNDHIENE